MTDYLVDTGVFVDHLRGARRFVPKSHRVHYSVVTRAELFAGNTASDAVRVVLAPFGAIDSTGTSPRELAGYAVKPGFASPMLSSLRRQSRTS